MIIFRGTCVFGGEGLHGARHLREHEPVRYPLVRRPTFGEIFQLWTKASLTLVSSMRRAFGSAAYEDVACRDLFHRL